MTNPIDETPSKPLGIAIYSPSGCPQCDYHLDNPYDIQITEIVATEKGWIAKGSGLDFPADRGDGATPGGLTFIRQNTIEVGRTCLNCGTHYNAILQTIPIISAQFTCPNCGKKENFKYVVHRVAEDKDAFQFEVELKCTVCEKKRTIKKIVKGLLSAVKLEVGPMGISVKNS